jgi:homopolymeric O-antigen transport system ATP-binding protein
MLSPKVRPVIEVENVSKRYKLGQFTARTMREEVEQFFHRIRGKPAAGSTVLDSSEFWALRDVSFAVQPGEVIGIIGRNGAGKSTLLKILSRITEPTKGEIRLRGRVASLLEVGTGFHPELTGRENIYLNGTFLGMTRADVKAKFDEIVAFAEVEKFLDTPIKRYSSGMYVRLAFAVAAHLEPEILVVDEVLAVGDASFQQKCLGKIREVSTGHGRTVLFVSHNLDAVRTLCSRSIWLEQGCVKEDGRTELVTARFYEEVYRSLWNHCSFTRNKLLVENVEALGASGQCQDYYRFLEPAGIRIWFVTAEPDLRVSCGIGFTNARGELVFGINSRDLGLRPMRIQSRTKLEIWMPTQNLLPGRYHLWLQVHDSSGDVLLDEKHIRYIDVLPPLRSAYSSLGSGVVHISTVWKLH